MFVSNFGLGEINPPASIGEYADTPQAGLILFLNNLITLVITISGIFVLVNLIIAGYQYLSSDGDSQKVSQAGMKIINSLIGLIIVAASFVIAGLLGQILFQDPSALISPKFYKISQ